MFSQAICSISESGASELSATPCGERDSASESRAVDSFATPCGERASSGSPGEEDESLSSLCDVLDLFPRTALQSY